MSYNTIFSVVNEHTASTVIVRYAISLAMACKARLVLYAAHAEGDSETMLRRTDLHMDHLVTAASQLEIPVTRVTEEGDIGKLLPKRVRAEHADLVCYSLLPDERYGANLRRHTVHHLLRTIRYRSGNHAGHHHGQAAPQKYPGPTRKGCRRQGTAAEVYHCVGQELRFTGHAVSSVYGS